MLRCTHCGESSLTPSPPPAPRQDESDAVVGALVDSARTWLPLLAVEDGAARAAAIGAVAPGLIAAARRPCVSRSWRRQARPRRAAPLRTGQ